MKKFHYVYISTDDIRFYIGVRSSECHPSQDNYLGSFTDETFEPNKKFIVRVFSTREAANAYEIYLHEVNKVDVNPLFANKYKSNSEGFHCYKVPKTDSHKKKIGEARLGRFTGENSPHYGKPRTEETKRKISKSNKNKPKSKVHRKKLSEARKGKYKDVSHSFSDKKVYLFVNKDGRTFEGTKWEFQEQFDLNYNSVKCFVGGGCFTLKGWRATCII